MENKFQRRIRIKLERWIIFLKNITECDSWFKEILNFALKVLLNLKKIIHNKNVTNDCIDFFFYV